MIAKPFKNKIYYQLDAYSDGISWSIYVVRSIRKGKVFATLKDDFTWGKLSIRHAHYGWFSSIPLWCRKSWLIGDDPYGLYTTKILAINAKLKYLITHNVYDDDENKINKKLTAVLKGMKTHLKNNKG